MKANFTLCLILLCFSAFSQEKPNIILHFENLKSDSVIIGYSSFADPNNEITDTAIFKSFSNVVIVPLSLIHKFKNGNRFFLQGSLISFFMDSNDRMVIKAKVDEGCVNYVLTGNKISTQYAEFARYNLDMNKEKVRYEFKFNEKKSSENTLADKKEYSLNKAKNDSTFQAKSLAFSAAHPDYEVSPRLLMGLKNKDEVIKNYNKLNREVQESYFGKIMGSKISGWFAITPNKPIPNFEALTLEGEAFKLSELKGKFVVLDFWGSWCGPCLTEIPQLKLFYEKNKKHLEIVGLICKDSKAGALKVVNDKGLTWT
ncbi:MAG: TlpA family protein disulfide reductase, partial [Pedobacter sp.]|nr:TlpA family protein disulfide reductase [Pedobacter sp.]